MNTSQPWIGERAFVLEILSVAVPLFILVVVIWCIRHSPERKNSRVGYIACGFASIMLVLLSYRFFNLVRGRIFLKNLDPSAVEWIQVGDGIYSEAGSVETIVSALNNAWWFLPDHEGWGEEIPVRLFLKSGQTRRFAVAYSARRRGAVLRIRGGSVLLLPELPIALKQVGTLLPAQP